MVGWPALQSWWSANWWWALHWLLTLGFAGVAVFWGRKYLRAIDQGKEKSVASSDKRRKTYTELSSESSALTSFDTPQFLLEIAVSLYERKHAAISSLDDKAQKLVALIGGGASLFALLAGFTGALHALLTPLLGLSALCFLASLVALLLSLAPVETDLPAITMFNSVPILANASFRAKIARRFIEAWQEMTLGLTPVLRKKGRLIYVASLLIVAGAAALLLNFILLLGKPEPTQQGAQEASKRVCHAIVSRKNRRTVTLTCKSEKK